MSVNSVTQTPSKSLVLCCDGTWNSPDQMVHRVRSPTNVTKIALGVAAHDADGRRQLTYYQRGVGTRQFQRFRGGAVGYGLSRNIRAVYRFIVEAYEPGDKLYFFGFSRGAYTARSVVGLIRNCGILRPEHSDRIAEAYSLYRSRANRAGPDTIASELFRRTYAHAPDPPQIHFVGVWDTVGSVGIPIDGIRVPFLDKYWGFHDTKLSRSVESAYHALAIDEQRRPFKPTLWKQPDPEHEQILEQVWFAGVHCDVGGGYSEPELAEIPLRWMARCARDRGLAFDSDHLLVQEGKPEKESRSRGERLAPDPLGELHSSYKGMYRLLGRRRRTLTRGNGQAAATTAVRRLEEMSTYHSPSLAAWMAADGARTNPDEGSWT